MISTITQIQPNGTWNSQYGLMYQFEVQFDDGKSINVNAKTEEPPYKVGDKVSYEITGSNKYGSKGKIQKADFDGSPQKSFGGQSSTQKDELIARQTCIKASAELYAQRSDWSVSQVIATAQMFTEYCLTGKMTLPNISEDEEGLPF